MKGVFKDSEQNKDTNFVEEGRLSEYSSPYRRIPRRTVSVEDMLIMQAIF